MLQNSKEEKYITLKEAAKISGYAPDYIGQLIRKGKLHGKQMYCAVAWMTTEEAIKQYVQKSAEKQENPSLADKIQEKFQQIKTRALLEIQLARLFKTTLYLTIILSISLSLLLFYILSVNIEKKLEQRALDNLEADQRRPASLDARLSNGVSR